MISRQSRLRATTLLVSVCLVFGCDGQGGIPSAGGVEANAVLPDLIRGLTLRDPASRARSATAIGRLGPAAKEAVPALIVALKDRDLSVRAAAAYTLGQIGPDAKRALPELENLTKQASLREVAAKAIKQIGG